MQKAHLTLLSRFMTDDFVQRRDLSDLLKLTSEESKIVLQNIARIKPGKGWHLLFPFDESFADSHDEIINRHAQQIYEHLEL